MAEICYCGPSMSSGWKEFPLPFDWCGDSYQITQDQIDGCLSQLDREWFTEESALAPAQESTLKDRFFRLAEQWNEETGHFSSTKEITSNPNYQEIIRLGWDVVPYLLRDLQQNKRFWFPALYEITKIRPFDLCDAGNSRRMVKAWTAWGKRKGLI